MKPICLRITARTIMIMKATMALRAATTTLAQYPLLPQSIQPLAEGGLF